MNRMQSEKSPQWVRYMEVARAYLNDQDCKGVARTYIDRGAKFWRSRDQCDQSIFKATKGVTFGRTTQETPIRATSETIGYRRAMQQAL